MFNYIINFDFLAEQNAPPTKRKEKSLAWYRSLMKPLNTINNAFFNVYFKDVKERAKRTGQKIILEDTLNKIFNNFGIDKIHIDNRGDDLSTSFFYNENEGYPSQDFYNQSENIPNYLSNETEFFGKTGFVVYVPTLVLQNYSNAQIENEVRKYNPIGTNFTIIAY